jgi:hypothetical protein
MTDTLASCRPLPHVSLQTIGATLAVAGVEPVVLIPIPSHLQSRQGRLVRPRCWITAETAASRRAASLSAAPGHRGTAARGPCEGGPQAGACGYRSIGGFCPSSRRIPRSPVIESRWQRASLSCSSERGRPDAAQWKPCTRSALRSPRLWGGSAGDIVSSSYGASAMLVGDRGRTARAKRRRRGRHGGRDQRPRDNDRGIGLLSLRPGGATDAIMIGASGGFRSPLRASGCDATAPSVRGRTTGRRTGRSCRCDPSQCDRRARRHGRRTGPD